MNFNLDLCNFFFIFKVYNDEIILLKENILSKSLKFGTYFQIALQNSYMNFHLIKSSS